jgi:hypothetical protein
LQAERLDPAVTSNLVRDTLAHLEQLVDERLQLGPESKLKGDKRAKGLHMDEMIKTQVLCTLSF